MRPLATPSASSFGFAALCGARPVLLRRPGLGLPGSKGWACTGQPRTARPAARSRPAIQLAAGASNLGGSGAAPVDDATVRRLVQHSVQVALQHGKTQQLAAEEVAARVRLLLADGFSVAQVASVIERSKGTPYFDVAQAAQTLGLLRRLGLTADQRAGCVAEFPNFLTCSPEQVAAVVQLLRVERGANKQQMVQLICRDPRLLSFLPETLAAKLAWWRGQARSQATQRAVLGSLQQFPGVLHLDVNTVELSKLALLQARLGASDEAMARKLPAAIPVMGRDMECTVLPRVDFLLRLLGDTEAVRRRVLNYLTVLALDEGSMLATLKALEGRMGSREGALGVLRRCLRLFATGTELGRNFDALVGVVGSEEAAQSIVRKDALVLTRDLSQPSPAARIAFWCQELGLAAGELLQAQPSLPLRRLDTVAPRWAWVQRYRHGLGAKYVQQADADCMAKYGVPLAGFAEFKAAWLASEEGRAVCRHERTAAGSNSGGHETDLVGEREDS